MSSTGVLGVIDSAPVCWCGAAPRMRSSSPFPPPSVLLPPPPQPSLSHFLPHPAGSCALALLSSQWGAAYELDGTFEEQQKTLEYLEWREKQYDIRRQVGGTGGVEAGSKHGIGGVRRVA
eukprot:352537-Chlamydomonas_euryale.AAC.1